MQKHTKIYMDFFGYGEQDYVPCEWCGLPAVDVHHIDGRGPGKDVIEKLVGLCRKDHIEAGANPEFNEKVRARHLKYMERGYVPC